MYCLHFRGQVITIEHKLYNTLNSMSEIFRNIVKYILFML